MHGTNKRANAVKKFVHLLVTCTCSKHDSEAEIPRHVDRNCG